MGRILEDLFNGNLNPNSKDFLRGTQYDAAMRVIAESEEKLLALLEGEAKELFLSNISAHGEIELLTALEHFVSGFRLGARILVEVFWDQDANFTDIE